MTSEELGKIIARHEMQETEETKGTEATKEIGRFLKSLLPLKSLDGGAIG